MVKKLFSIFTISLILGCGTGSHVSEVRVPPSKSSGNTQIEDKQDSIAINFKTEEYSDTTNISTLTETDEPDSSIEIRNDGDVGKRNSIDPPEKINESVVIKKSEPVKITTSKSNNPSTTKPIETKKTFNYRNFNRDAYRTGEKLTFNINYLAITAGEATMAVTDEFNYNNRLVQKIVFEANSSRSYSWIYKVEDKYISYLDKIGIYPWKFNKEINEGSFHTKEEVIFDHIKEEAREGEKVTKIPPYVHDIISAFYFVRNNDLSNMRPGDIIKLSNYSSGKIHPLDVRFKGWEKIKVPAGTFNCVVLEPLVKAGGLFKDEGTLVIWLTNDELKIPVKVETKVVIGSINVELKKIEGVNRSIPAKVN